MKHFFLFCFFGCSFIFLLLFNANAAVVQSAKDALSYDIFVPGPQSSVKAKKTSKARHKSSEKKATKNYNQNLNTSSSGDNSSYEYSSDDKENIETRTEQIFPQNPDAGYGYTKKYASKLFKTYSGYITIEQKNIPNRLSVTQGSTIQINLLEKPDTIWYVELNEDGTALKNPATAKDDKILIAGIVGPWDGATYEGAYIRKINEYYYFFGSQGTCCAGVNSTYHVKVARSKSITGPYVDASGVDMLGKDRGELVVQGDQNVAGPGHMSLFQDDANDWWMVYHGYDKLAPTGRMVFMDKLVWDENGFPHLVSNVPSYFRTMAGPKINYGGENNNEE